MSAAIDFAFSTAPFMPLAGSVDLDAISPKEWEVCDGERGERGGG